jgi:hypothetical protein
MLRDAAIVLYATLSVQCDAVLFSFMSINVHGDVRGHYEFEDVSAGQRRREELGRAAARRLRLLGGR